MNYLIDTHIFLWLLFDPKKISSTQMFLLEQPENSIYLSDISLWEISLKYSIGKLSLDGITPDKLPSLAKQMGISLLPLNSQSAASFHQLAKLKHKDPFDRMIIWQAIEEDCILISNDSSFAEYESLGLKLATTIL